MESQVPTTATETASFWTEEKHVQFLNSIEASFVTAMLENNSRLIHCLRRPLPDTSESTSDLKPHRSTTNHTLSDLIGGRGRKKGRRSTRRRSSQPYNSLQDQVVPQMGYGQEDITDEPDQTSHV